MLTKDQLLTLDRFRRRISREVGRCYSRQKSPPLERFLYGLGIRHVGIQTAIDLIAHFAPHTRKESRFSSSITGEILGVLREATIDELQTVTGVGDVVAESIAAWFTNEDNIALLAKMKSLGVEPH